MTSADTDPATPLAGDPDRFLAWLREATCPPVTPDLDDPAWEQLVHDAFAYAQRSHARTVSTESTARLACRPGCGMCCHLPVFTTEAEAVVAWRHAERHLPARKFAAIRERAACLPRHIPEPCPFLEDDQCSVYAVRPLSCRAWNSTDVTACRRAHGLGYEGVRIPTLTVARLPFVNAAEALARGVEDRGGEGAVLLRGVLEGLAGESLF